MDLVSFAHGVKGTLQWMSALPAVGTPASDEAAVLVTAIAGQESRWAARRQIGGPARSYWQFERGGGVAGLFRVTPRQLGAVCTALDIPCNDGDVFEAMAWHDDLACAMARLLVWTDPAPLPPIGDRAVSWAYYQRNWRPGAPHPDSWAGVYDQAVSAVRAG